MVERSGTASENDRATAATTTTATTWRAWVWATLEDGEGPLGRAIAACVAILILLNAAAVVLESVDALRAAYGGWFFAFELFSVLVFTVEFGLRVWSSAEAGSRVAYLRTPYAIIDIIAIAPFYLGVLFGWDLRVLRLLRLLRLAKLSRYFAPIQALGAALQAEFRPMAAAAAIMGLLIVVAASLMYFAERAAQPDDFADIPSAMWWAAVTLTTVGYGDVAPVTTAGRIIAVFVMALGVGMVALPAGMLASRFSDELAARRSSYAERAAQTRDAAEKARIRQEIGLADEDARRIDAAPSGVCPTCGGPVRSDGRARPPGS